MAGLSDDLSVGFVRIILVLRKDVNCRVLNRGNLCFGEYLRQYVIVCDR